MPCHVRFPTGRGGLAIPVFALHAGLVSLALTPASTHATPTGLPVVVAPVERADLAATQPFVGTVYPARVSDVGSAVDGRVVTLPIEDGQRVAAGEPIAELLRGLLEIERSGAAAELERRSQVLGELRAGSRPEEIEQARAVAAGLAARLEYARNRLSRLTRLAERGTSTEDELLVAQTDVNQAEAQLAGARAALALAEAGPRTEAIAQAAAAQAAQKAELERIDDQLGKHTIRAPFAGWVVARFTEEGQWLARGGLVARIAELDRVEVEVQVPELAVRTLHVGADVRLEIDAAPQQTWIGRVERIVPQADLLSRSFPVKVLLDNIVVDGQPVLRGGMLARAWLPVGRTGPATVVPKDALVLGGGTPVVYVVDVAAAPGTGAVRAVPVAPGAAVAGAVEVRGDLEPGQLVVVRGNERLRAGTSVSFTP